MRSQRFFEIKIPRAGRNLSCHFVAPYSGMSRCCHFTDWKVRKAGRKSARLGDGKDLTFMELLGGRGVEIYEVRLRSLCVVFKVRSGAKL